MAGILGVLGTAAGAVAEPLPPALSGARAGRGMIGAIGKSCAPGHADRCRRARALGALSQRDRAVAEPDDEREDAAPFHGWYVGINGGYGWSRQ